MFPTTSKGALVFIEDDDTILINCNADSARSVEMLCAQNGYATKTSMHPKFFMASVYASPAKVHRGMGINPYGDGDLDELIGDLKSEFGRHITVIG